MSPKVTLRDMLLNCLNGDTPLPAYPKMMVDFIHFLDTNPNCFERSNKAGHVTASAWITSEDSQTVLLLHHAKLKRWLQPGGHCDGNPDVKAVAIKEAQEETGLDVEITLPGILGIDIHHIPERGDEPSHLHYDVCFSMRAKEHSSPIINHESSAFAWVPVNHIVEEFDNNPYLQRLAHNWGKLHPSQCLSTKRGE